MILATVSLSHIPVILSIFILFIFLDTYNRIYLTRGFKFQIQGDDDDDTGGSDYNDRLKR